MKSILLLSACALCTVLAACATTGGAAHAPTAAAAAATTTAAAGLEQWRARREAQLREPDGWLSFSGSGPVHEGSASVGSAADNVIVVPKGPAHWGTLSLQQGQLRFDAAADSGVTVGGQAVQSAPLLTQLEAGGPTAVHAGAQRFYVVRTGEIYGWRFRDPQSPALAAFKGVPHFAPDPSWRIEATWVAYVQPEAIELVTSNGSLEPAQIPGEARFERDGRALRLRPVTEDGGKTMFFIIADRTSGRETYGGARFLYVDAPVDGRIVLDFNRAENPPCALNGHVVCPLPPPGNRLPIRIEAGEKTFPLQH